MVRRTMERRNQVPRAKVLRERGRVRSLRSRVAGAVDPMRPHAGAALSIALGFLPLWIVIGTMLGLAWMTALNAGP
jgi:hypothetical protein